MNPEKERIDQEAFLKIKAILDRSTGVAPRTGAANPGAHPKINREDLGVLLTLRTETAPRS